jgi:hypothetical protein
VLPNLGQSHFFLKTKQPQSVETNNESASNLMADFMSLKVGNNECLEAFIRFPVDENLIRNFAGA